MKPRHWGLGGAVLCATALLLWGPAGPVSEAGLAEPAPRRPAAALAAAPSAQTVGVLLPRAELFAVRTVGEVFGQRDFTPPPPAPVVAKAAAPSAPPLPFTYLGKMLSAGRWEVYLARADQTFVVREAMLIDGLYRVDSIAPPTLSLTYVPMNKVQQLNIGVME